MTGAALRPSPPRGLILLASLWLVVSWTIHIGLRPPVQAHAASYTPGVRMMLLSLALGICVAWPLLRLSGPPRAWPIRQALLDLAVVLCLAQVVVWPLRLVTPWPPLRSAAIDLCLLLWGCAAAALIALGTRSIGRGGNLVRVSCMLAVVLSVAVVPLASLARGQAPAVRLVPPSPHETAWWREAAWSPLTAIHALSGGGVDEPSAQEWALARTGGWIALAAWSLAIGVTVGFRRAATPHRERR